jgi:hypothetical protein
LSNPQEKFVFLDRACAILASVTNSNLRETYTRQVSTMAFIPLDSVKKGIEEATPLTSEGEMISSRPVRSAKKSAAEEGDEDAQDNEDTAVNARYGDLDHTAEKDVLKRIDSNKVYSAAIKALHLGVLNRAEQMVQEQLADRVESFPKSLRGFVEEMNTYIAKDSPIVPELFSMPLVAEKVLDPALMPLSNAMSNADMRELFDYLLTYLEKEKQRIIRKRKVSESMNFISSAEINDIQALEKAIKEESLDGREN